MTRTLYRGGRLYAPGPPSSAFVVEDGVFAWVGSDAAADALGAVDAVVELDGAWVAPAFVDAHVHVVAAGLARQGLDVSSANTRDEVLDRVREAAAALPAGALVWGTGWDETRWPIGQQQPPTGAELDRAAAGRPVYLARTDVHSAVVSTALLQDAGWADGSPLVGAAHHAVRRAARARLTPEQREAAAENFLTWCLEQGIGMVHECGGPEIGDGDELTAVRRVADAVGIELVAYWGQIGAAGIAAATALDAEPGGDLFVDGSLGSHTAALVDPYADLEGDGWLQLDADAIAAHVVAATAAGRQAGFHVIGDRAVATALRGLEAAAEVIGLPPVAAARHRLEHLEMCGPDDAQRLARLGVIASLQPTFDAVWGGAGGMYATRLGSERAHGMNNFAQLTAAGVPLALGTDAPVTASTPWETLRAVTQPHERSHALSGRAGFTAHTRGGYRAARRDDAGLLRTGSQATFAVWGDAGELVQTVPDGRVAAWSTDPRAGVAGLPDLDAEPPTCLRTVVRGRTAYVAG